MDLTFGCSTIIVLISLVTLAGLIIATITAPAVSSLALAEAENISYGALGYCFTKNSTCVTGSPSYNVSNLTSLTDWTMDDSARDTLAKILIVIPIAAGLTLISLLFNLLNHLRAINASFIFRMIAFFFTLLSFFGSAITVIVTFMLFYPHVKWPAWFLIASGVLSLISVPLSFFSLKTSGSRDSDEDDESEEKNLTDLSDGPNFKREDSLNLNDYPVPPFGGASFTASTDKNDYAAIKVITDDSSLSHDNFEKVSFHDYSKMNTNATNYRGYDNSSHNGSNSALGQSNYSDGTPNLVSPQNYSKGGAVRLESHLVQPESAKPEFGSTAYPNSQYSSNPQRNVPTNLGSKNQVTAGSGSNVLTSNHGTSLSDDADYDNELVNDNDSDFTSVSQRAANPRYYRGLQNSGPSLFPNKESQHAQFSNAQIGYQGIANQNSYLPQQPTSYQNYAPQPYQQQPVHAPQQQLQYQGYQQQQQYQAVSAPPLHAKPQQFRDTSAALISANPDFSIGGSTQRQSFNKARAQAPIVSGYKPAYKRAQGANKVLPAASLSNDSPYNFR